MREPTFRTFTQAHNVSGARHFGVTQASCSGLRSAVHATRSVITGTDFGDNLIAALPDAIGDTIGNMVAGQINGSNDLISQVQQNAAANLAADQQAKDAQIANTSFLGASDLVMPTLPDMSAYGADQNTAASSIVASSTNANSAPAPSLLSLIIPVVGFLMNIYFSCTILHEKCVLW